MNRNAMIAIAFIVGAAAGAASTWFTLREYYRHIADEEIESIRELYKPSRKKSNQHDDDKSNAPQPTQESIADYKININKTDYASMFASANPHAYDEKTQTEILEPRPYIIAPSEFGMGNDYDLITVDYFSDGTLIFDVDDSVVEDIENVIGSDCVNHFGEYEDDAVYVRNDRLKFDYEILKREETFEEYLKKKENAPAGMIV